MNSYYYALSSVKKWGGEVDMYLPLHQFLDSSKMHCITFHHRMVLHSTFGIQVAQQVFGPVIDVNGVKIPVIDICIQHIREDLGHVPTLKEWMDGLRPSSMQDWMVGKFTQKPKTKKGKLKV